MALPDTVSTVTVSGPVLHPFTGAPLTGSAEFEVPALSVSDGSLIGGGSETLPFVNGDFVGANPILPASDGPNITPRNWMCKVTIRTDIGWNPVFLAPLPAAQPTITLGTLYAQQVTTPPPVDLYLPLSAAGSTVAQLVDGTVPLDQLPPSASGVNSVNDLTGDVHLDAAGVQADPAGSAAAVAASLTAEVTRAEGAESALGTAVAGKYAKPGSGIPPTDLTSAAQSALTEAASAYQKPGGGIPESDLSAAVQAKLDAGGGGGSSTVVVRGYITSGNIAALNTAGAWLPLAGTDQVIAAAVGDQVGADYDVLFHADAGTFYDVAVLAAGSVVRLLGSPTYPPSSGYEGRPGWYPVNDFPGQTTMRDFVATSGDIEDGQVRFAIAQRSGGSGTAYAEDDHPMWFRLINAGPE